MAALSESQTLTPAAPAEATPATYPNWGSALGFTALLLSIVVFKRLPQQVRRALLGRLRRLRSKLP